MPKVRTSLLIIGIILAMLAASVLTVLGLFLSGVISEKKPELEFTVVAVDEKEYDGTPLKATSFSWTSGADQLKAGHYVEGRILGEQIDYGTSETDLQVKVYDDKGRDVTGEYSITVNNTELKVTPRAVTIVLEGDLIPYSGAEIPIEKYAIFEGTENGQVNLSQLASKELAKGDRLAISFPNFKNVGDKLPDSAEWKPENFKIYNEAGKLVSDNYQMSFGNLGNLEIVPRKLGVRVFDVEKYFDGAPIEVAFQHVWGTLIGNDFIYGVKVVDERGSEVKTQELIKAPTNKKVKISNLVLYKQNGFDTVELSEAETKNYELVDESDSEYITLSIKKRPVEVKAKDIIKPYDGFALSETLGEEVLYTVSDLPTQFKLTASNKDLARIIDVYDGTYSMNEYFVAYGSSDVSDQFDVTFQPGIVKITPLTIRSFLSPCSDTYQQGEEIAIPVKTAVGTALSTNIDSYMNTHARMSVELKNLLDALKDAETYFEAACAQTIKDAGEYKFTLELNDAGLELIMSVTSPHNIAFEFVSGTMTVERIAISVWYYGAEGRTEKITKKYDGNPAEIYAANLVADGGENLTISSADFRYEQGGATYYGNRALVGVYNVVFGNVHITCREDETTYVDVTKNYRINAPTIEVEIKKATIKIASKTPIMSATAADIMGVARLADEMQETVGESLIIEGLANGDTVSGEWFGIETEYSMSRIDFYIEVNMAAFSIQNSDGTDVTSCYEFEGLDGDETDKPVVVVYIYMPETD